MKIVAVTMFAWFISIALVTMYGMYKEKSANRFDVFIGFILAPALTFLAAFIAVGA